MSEPTPEALRFMHDEVCSLEECSYEEPCRHCIADATYLDAFAATVSKERDELRVEVEELRAARFAYASEFDGDIGSIHENIRKLKALVVHIAAGREIHPGDANDKLLDEVLDG